MGVQCAGEATALPGKDSEQGENGGYLHTGVAGVLLEDVVCAGREKVYVK